MCSKKSIKNQFKKVACKTFLHKKSAYNTRNIKNAYKKLLIYQ